MSLKAKLISTIAAFCLVISLLFVGVFAANNVSIQMGGQVTFTATDVYGDVTITYSGAANNPARLYADFDASTPDGTMTWDEGNPSEQNLVFNQGDPIRVTIAIHNEADDRAMWVLFENLPSITSAEFSSILSVSTSHYGVNGTENTLSANTPFSIPANTTYQVVFDLTLSSYNQTIEGEDATWTCNFALSNSQPSA